MPAKALCIASRSELRFLKSAPSAHAARSLYLRVLKFLMGQLSEDFAKSKRGSVA